MKKLLLCNLFILFVIVFASCAKNPYNYYGYESRDKNIARYHKKKGLEKSAYTKQKKKKKVVVLGKRY